MKKVLIILPIILIMTACSARPAPIQKEFKAEVTSRYNGVKLKAEIITNGHNMMTLEMKAPKSLNGYIYVFKNSKVKLEYDGMQIKCDSDYLPPNSFAAIIYNVLKSVNRDEAQHSGSHNNLAEYTGKTNGNTYTITSDYNTGYISKIELKELYFTAKFKIR